MQVEVDSARFLGWLRAAQGFTADQMAKITGARDAGYVLAWEAGTVEPNESQWRIILAMRPWVTAPGRSEPFERFLKVKV